jgi:hypothetical protein
MFILLYLVALIHAADLKKNPLGITPPFFDLETGFSTQNLVFIAQLLAILIFVNIPKKSLQVLQGQAIVMEGVYLTLDQLVYPYLYKARKAYWFVLVAAAAITAGLSYDARFRQLYLSGVAAFILSYYITLVARIPLYPYFLGLFGLLYLVLFIAALQNEILVLALAKASLVSYGVMAFIDIWREQVGLFKYMHGIEGATKMWIGFGVGGTIIVLVFSAVFYLTYNAEWAERKAEELKREVV